MLSKDEAPSRNKQPPCHSQSVPLELETDKHEDRHDDRMMQRLATCPGLNDDPAAPDIAQPVDVKQFYERSEFLSSQPGGPSRPMTNPASVQYLTSNPISAEDSPVNVVEDDHSNDDDSPKVMTRLIIPSFKPAD